MRGFAGGAGVGVGFAPANFFAACFASPNLCQSNELADVGPAGFCFWSAFSCPFNWRNENGTRIFGATKSVCTKSTVPRKASTPKRSRPRRNRGQRFPAGSEKTKGGRLSRGLSCMSCLFSLSRERIKASSCPFHRVFDAKCQTLSSNFLANCRALSRKNSAARFMFSS